METEVDQRYQALTARDPRFDGVFFVGVRTTGIYCRPVCPAKTPRPENCSFYNSAASAEKAGFRPCRRCRPELAPGNACVDAVSRVAAAAATRIEDGALNDSDMESLAAELGLSSRQLRRAMQQEFGVSPVELAQTRRLLLARRLLAETALSATEIAFASGFSSVRRFNALFQERYRLSPTEFRRSDGRRLPADTLRFELAYRPPLAWKALLKFHHEHAFGGVEAVTGDCYLRTAGVGPHQGWLAVQPAPGRSVLQVEMSASLAPAVLRLLRSLRHLFDLGAQPERIETHLAADPWMEPLVSKNPGLRVPGAFDPLELALRTVLGQQVSVRAATTVAGRFARAFGEPVETPHTGLTHLSPTAERLAAAEVPDLTALGVTRSRALCIQGLARAVSEGSIRLEPGPDVGGVMERLRALPGIGEWTAEYVALRGLRWPDAFPATDLGVRKALGGAAGRQILEIAEAWRPWRGYAVMHLWKSLEV